MNIICIIPARGGSKGIHKKNIVDFIGKPLISYSIEQALGSKYINEVVVTSDSNEILDISKKYGAVPFKRPYRLSNDTSTSELALLDCLDRRYPHKKVDLVVFLQATSPLRTSRNIDKAISTLIQEKYDSLFSAVEAEDLFMWGLLPDSSLNTSLNYNYKNRKRRQDCKSQIVENGSIYVFKPYILYRYNNRMGDKIGYSLMKKWQIYEIDTYEDLELCKFIYKQRILK